MTRAFPLLALLLAASCGQNLEMSDQKKYRDYEPATLFRNGQVLQAAPAGTVARDAPAGNVYARKPPMSLALVQRGRERFDIFCAPCHGPSGDGDGMVVQRGMPRPPSYHDPRLVAAPDAHFVDVIANGYGAMYSYADRVPPADRWAIAAYIRALQRSRTATIADVPPAARAKLLAEGTR
ncbi:MAG TPA: cytochrome c [Allosphingosinicella sp.]